MSTSEVMHPTRASFHNALKDRQPDLSILRTIMRPENRVDLTSVDLQIGLDITLNTRNLDAFEIIIADPRALRILDFLIADKSALLLE